MFIPTGKKPIHSEEPCFPVLEPSDPDNAGPLWMRLTAVKPKAASKTAEASAARMEQTQAVRFISASGEVIERTTIAALAEELKVSRKAVSRALAGTGHTCGGTVQRIPLAEVKDFTKS